MSWRLEETQDLDLVADLYRAVFNNSIDPRSLAERAGDRTLHAYTVSRPGDEPAGFALFLGQGSDVELWQAGVMPTRRQLGAGTCLIAAGERAMAERGYSRLTVRTFNHWNVMLSMLTRRGWRVVGTGHSERHQDLYIDLHKVLRTRRELRYAITHACNFACVFCHMEGLGERERREPAPTGQVLATLRRAVELGYTDITFTGGEPLLEKERLLALLVGLAGLPEPPDVTVVSNGALLDDRVVAKMLAYPGRCKLHLSLHAADPESFGRVTGTRKAGLFERVRANVQSAASAGLTVKVNHVVLQEYNHEQIVETVELARSLGATALKLLELLVLPQTADDFRLFYKVSALDKPLATVAEGPEPDGLRRKLWRHRTDSSFVIEVQQLTCALGCSHCLEVRDRTLSSDLRYHPCFVRCDESYPVTDPSTLQAVFDLGDRIIDDHAAKYGDESPTMVYEERMVPWRSGVYLHVSDPDALRTCLRATGAPPPKLWAVHEEHFRPRRRGPSWDRWERSLRIGWARDDLSKAELVYTDQSYEPLDGLGLLTRERFLFAEGPLDLGSPDKARHLLDRLDFELFLILAWDLEFWDVGACRLSLGSTGGLATVKVEGGAEEAQALMELLARHGGEGLMKPLDEPLVGWIVDQGVGLPGVIPPTR